MQFQTDYLHLITQHSLFLSPNHVAITHDIVFLSHCYYLRSSIARHAHALFHCFFLHVVLFLHSTKLLRP
uniref:Expressed protein n=1 Tax=Echinococcus granulosus TaxID=6210 RepID=A0A068WN07_ECHGR|nr:expressed protein [Echinococcus granulosus]